MGELSADLELKINGVMEEISDCDLDIDEKIFLKEKVLQAKACANGSTNKIDDMSKVLLHSTLHQVKSEVRLPAKISKVVREELRETEKNIARNTVEAINNHTNECFRRMENFQSQFVPDKSLHCTGCKSSEGTGDGDLDDIIDGEEGETKKEKKPSFLSIGWLKMVGSKYPIQTGVLFVILLEKYGLESIIKLVGSLLGLS